MGAVVALSVPHALGQDMASNHRIFILFSLRHGVNIGMMKLGGPTIVSHFAYHSHFLHRLKALKVALVRHAEELARDSPAAIAAATCIP